jgi:protein arginine N-methyltransferase 1
MYSLQGYGNMIADAVRTDAYAAALRAAVRPGCLVVDIGTGPGLFAILACRFGARRVIAIESGDIIEVARRVASANGCADRIEFLHADSRKIEIGERADVVVADLHGVLPYFGRSLETMKDAHARFLARDGVMIPARETILAACVEAPELHGPVTSPWSDNKYELDMRAARALAANQWRRAVVRPEQIVGPPCPCGTIDYSSIDSEHFEAKVPLAVERTASGHGLCLWFDSTLYPGVEIRGGPGVPGLIYGSAFFPWPESVALIPGDRIEARFSARVMRGDYLWTWETRVMRGTSCLARFRQSDFFGEPLEPAKLRRQSAAHVPRLGDEGRVTAYVLALMTQEVALGDIARRLSERYPEEYPRWQDALTLVGDLSERYST